jgi:hypothetical protein
MSQGLRAGAALTAITPPLGTSLAGSFTDRKAAEVHDDLYAHALVLENAGTRLALVSLDLIVLPEAPVAAARELIAARTGIPAEHALIACTHTHSGPATAGLLGVDADEDYVAWLPARVAGAVEAAARRQPAVLGSTRRGRPARRSPPRGRRGVLARRRVSRWPPSPDATGQRRARARQARRDRHGDGEWLVASG